MSAKLEGDALKERIERLTRLGVVIPGCQRCLEQAADPHMFGPPHQASRLCRAQRSPHCTCTACFD